MGSHKNLEKFPIHVHKLCKRGIDIKAQMSEPGAHLVHMALGVAGESGELVDAVKKYAIYQKELDVENILEELGDLLFYIQGIANRFGVTLDSFAERNIQKLEVRYAAGTYSDAAAQKRADKATD